MTTGQRPRRRVAAGGSLSATRDAATDVSGSVSGSVYCCRTTTLGPSTTIDVFDRRGAVSISAAGGAMITDPAPADSLGGRFPLTGPSPPLQDMGKTSAVV